MKVQSIYNSKALKHTLKFASENGALFAATASLAFSTIRPVIIMATPHTDKENRQYASTKSIASTLTGYLLMLVASLPVANAVKNIDNNPKKFLKPETVKRLIYGKKSIKSSPKYNFATQLIKLGLGFLIAVPKSVITCAIIPPIMNKLYGNNENQKKSKDTSFKGSCSGIQNKSSKLTDKLSKGIASIINSNTVINMADKFHNTIFEQHIISLTDILATSAFINLTAKNNRIKDDRKKALMYNAGISTALSVTGGYAINKLTEKSTDKFVENFKIANKNSKNLDKYIEGIRVVKPVLILGTIYYILIPLISTFLSDKFDKKSKKNPV